MKKTNQQINLQLIKLHKKCRYWYFENKICLPLYEHQVNRLYKLIKNTL